GDSLLEEVQHHQQKAITNGDNRVLSRSNLQEGQLMLEALNGFVIFISRKGRILYVAENVVKHLGIPQHDMIGNNIVEFIHPDDQKELSKQFIVKRPGQQSYKGFGVQDSGDSPLSMEVHFFGDQEKKCVSTLDYIQERSFFMRVRSVTPKKGTGGKGKIIGYRVMFWRHFIQLIKCGLLIYFIVIVKGTSVSKYYRFLGKSSEWIWMQTRATIIYNTNNEAQYVVCQNYVIGKDEGDKYLMLEQMQAAHANGCAAAAKQGDSEDSGIESSDASPNPNLGASSPGYSIYNSPGFMTVSEIDVMEIDMESQIIRDPVQHVKTQKVVKPKDEEDISFSGLVKKAECDGKLVNDIDVEMRVAGCAENIGIKVQNISTNKVGKSQMLAADSSPCSDADSVCSGSDISSVTSPPDLYSCERKEYKSLPMIDDSGDENMDESMIKDLLEITKDDYTKDNDSQPRYQNESVMFTVTSPAGFPACSPLSSKLTSVNSPQSTVNSPQSVNNCTGSPNDIFSNSPLSPARQFLDSELSDIVDKLSTEDISEASDLFSTLLGNNGSPFTLSSTTATKVTTVVSGDTSKGIMPGILETTIHKLDTSSMSNKAERKDSDSLPEELAEFSMEFCDKLVDQMASSAMIQLGGANMDCQEMPEIPSNMLTWMNNISPVTAPDVTLAHAADEKVETKEKIAPPEENKPIQQRCPTLFAHLTANTALEENTLQKDTPAHEVTEKISMLGISDDKNTPLLRALLTGDEVNPLASKPENTSDVIGPLTPMEKQITDTILDLEDTPMVDSRQIATNLQFENNNVAQQADLLVLQEQQRQRYILEQKQNDQQKRLINEHMHQRDMLEQKLNKQLILQQLLKQKLKESQLQEEQQKILEAEQTEQVQDQQLSHLKEKRLLLQRQLQERRQVLEQQQQLQQQLQQINLLQSPHTTNVALEKTDSLLQQYLQEPSRTSPPTNNSEAVPIQHQITQQFRPQCNIQQLTQPINQQPFRNGLPLSLPPQQQPWQLGLQQQQIPCQRNMQSNRQCQEQIQYPNCPQQDYPPPLVHQGLPSHLSQQIVDYHQQLHSMSPWQQAHTSLYNGNQQVVDQQSTELNNQDLSFPLQH
ncbi:uncharacterized protein LOC144353126, partial [Saccoglossus kowalevskii]